MKRHDRNRVNRLTPSQNERDSSFDKRAGQAIERGFENGFLFFFFQRKDLFKNIELLKTYYTDKTY